MSENKNIYDENPNIDTVTDKNQDINQQSNL